MNEYIVTYVVGDAYNIPTYDVISCEENDLPQKLDRDYGSWRTNRFMKVFQVSKELDKSELGENGENAQRNV